MRDEDPKIVDRIEDADSHTQEDVPPEMSEFDGDVAVGEIVDPEEVERALDQVADPVARRTLETIVHARFSGYPVPPPDIFSEYDDSVRDTFLQEWRAEAQHNRELDTVNLRIQRTGQWIGLVVAIVFLIGAVVLGLNGKEVAAGIIGGGTIVSLVTVFVLGRWSGAE